MSLCHNPIPANRNSVRNASMLLWYSPIPAIISYLIYPLMRRIIFP